MALTFTKAKRTFKILSSGSGRVIKGFHMPCGCKDLMVIDCHCRLRDKKCQICGRVFIPSGKDWYEVEDPHKDWREEC